MVDGSPWRRRLPANHLSDEWENIEISQELAQLNNSNKEPQLDLKMGKELSRRFSKGALRKANKLGKDIQHH